jgi:CubicO group peptidase (beta-lactamase class C family)
MPSIPEDAYAAQGHYGQAVIIIPSRELVVVRMGQTYNGSAWNMELFLSETLAALPE